MYFPFRRGFSTVVPCPPPAAPTCPVLGAPSCLDFPGMPGSCQHLPSWQKAGSSCRSSPRRSRQRAGMVAAGPGLPGHGGRAGCCTWARRPPSGMSAWSIIKHLDEGGSHLVIQILLGRGGRCLSAFFRGSRRGIWGTVT